MRELLYVSTDDLPEQILNHAILYRDKISTFVPDDSERSFSENVKCARDAGIFHARPIHATWTDISVKNEVLGMMKRGVARSLTPNYYLRKRKDGGYSEEKIESIYFKFPDDGSAWGQAADRLVGAEEWATTALNSEGRPIRVAGRGVLVDSILLGTALVLADRSRETGSSPLLLPSYPAKMLTYFENPAIAKSRGHLFSRIDVGRFLPEPPVGVETAVVVDFRRRYDSERRRLIRAVERLVEDAVRVHGKDEIGDIERHVREELKEALADVVNAGRRRFGGWVRRAAWFTIATGAGSLLAGPGGAAVGSVAANWASNLLSSGAKENDYNYLYRVQSALDEFARRS